MEFSDFHFATPVWLWGIGILPFIWLLYKLFFSQHIGFSQLEGFIDKHLLPHLVLPSLTKARSIWKSVAYWSMLWTLIMLGLANPQWDYKEVQTFSPDQSLCILLDISQSMDAQDIKPSRLIRARQKIEDLLNSAQGLKVSLIAFAADPHMVTPLTDDMNTIRNLLPSLGTDLAYIQGSKLSPALIMASRLLEAAQGKNKSILVVSDGEFEDTQATTLAQTLAQKGILTYTMGVGTEEGAPIPAPKGTFIKKGATPVISSLDKDKLLRVSQAGGGQYFTADYLDTTINTLLTEIKKRSSTSELAEHTHRQWEERFYIFVLPLMLFLLLWFRRGFVFPVVLLSLFLTPFYAQAQNFIEFFKNDAQIGQEALEEGNYVKALEKFTDPYHQGIAAYKAEQFERAADFFSQPQRSEVTVDALYNLGNALAKQQKLAEAIKAYEDVLTQNPEHQKAKHNLEIVKKLLEQKKEEEKKDEQKEDQEKNQEENQQQDASSDQKQNEQKDKNQKGNNENKDKDKDQNESSEQNKDTSSQGSQKNGRDDPEDSQHTPPQDPSQEQGDQQPPPADKTDNTGQENPPQKNTNSSGEQEPKPNPMAEKPKEQNASASSANPAPSPSSQQQENGPSPGRELTQQDLDANQWLDQITNNPKSFLKNQFYIESQQQGATEETDPW